MTEMAGTTVMTPLSFTLSTLFAVVMLSCMFSVHIASAQGTSTDESTSTADTTVASLNNASESTSTDDNTTVASTVGTGSFDTTTNITENISTDDAVATTDSTGFSTGTTETTEKSYNSTCNTENECGTNLTCTENRCDCRSDYYYNESFCMPKKSNGSTCTSGNECGNNLICVGNKCDCRSDYYYNGSFCVPKKSNGSICTSGNECGSNLICVGNNCGCGSENYYNGSFCVPKKSNGSICTSGNECGSNLICVGNNCGCGIENYYNGSFCVPKKSNGSICTSGNECGNNLICVGNNCGCGSENYYNGSFCVPKLNYGVECPNVSGECKDSHTVCTSYQPPGTIKCLCDSESYRTDNNVCSPRSNLQRIADVSRETRSVTLTWSSVSDRSNASYSITWDVANNISANKTGGTVAGLKPGTQHNFSVVTSLPADDSYQIIEVKQQPLVIVWTRPDKPGSVNGTRLNNSTYEITFGKSDGAVSLYTMTVTNAITGVLVGSQNSTSTVMHFTLEPATTYNYTLQSSNGNSQPDKSDTTTGQFTTDAEASDPVSGFNYTGVQAYRANVTWQTPSKPKGNITGYLVEVVPDNATVCLYYIKIPCHDCGQVVPNESNNCDLVGANFTSSTGGYNVELRNLNPYRNYTVNVVAVNEAGRGKPATLSFQTDIAVPNDISNVIVNSVRNISTQKVNLNIQWTPGDKTGPTNYYVLVQEKVEPGSEGYNENIIPVMWTGYGNTSYVGYDVLAYWDYKISVWAHTEKGNSSNLKVVQYTTVENDPGVVENLSVTQDATVANILTVTFECPEIRSRNGRIVTFMINQIRLNPQGAEDERTSYNLSASDGQQEPCNSGYKINVTDIMVERNYTFAVITVNNKYTGDSKNVSSFYVAPKVPSLGNLQELFHVDSLVTKQEGSSIELTKINTEVCSRCLTDNRWGRVTDVGLIVCVKGGNCTVSGRKKRSTTLQFAQFQSWGNAKLRDFKSEYRTTPKNWIPPQDGINTYSKFVVGDNTSCANGNADDYCNGPLPSGKEFIISVVMCTTAGCVVHKDDIIFATYVSPDETPVGAIVGGVLGGLALIAVIGVIIFLIFYMRKRNGQPTRTTTPDIKVDVKSKELVKKRPVKMRDFNDHVTKFHRDSNLLFQDEFESIRTVSDTFKNLCDEAKREQNRVKNRYADILPYDHSRVKLEILSDDDETNDFINANYIPGFNSVREYIATQGPMYSTIPDFWRMIWEQKCKVIAMLSDLTEAGKRKVDLYWPENLNEPINYGTVVVEMTNFSQLNKYIIRNFKLIKGEETRKVTHFFLPGWPDYGADVSFDVVLGFVKVVRQEVTPASQGPIVVHCSAGVGRSGTFIALDYFTQYVEKNSLDSTIDVFDFVLQMRKNRTRMVQVETQYIFIYDGINKLVQSRIKSEEEKLYENVSPGNGVYENFKPQEENIYANSTVKDDKYVYNNDAFEPDLPNNEKSDKPTTEL